MNMNNDKTNLLKSNSYDLMLKGKVKLDPMTPLEKAFHHGIWMCPLISVISLYLVSSTKNEIFMIGFFLGLFGFIPTILLYFLTDNYYILDCNQKVLKYRFKFLFFERLTNYVRFADIDAITLKSKKTISKGNRDFRTKRRIYWYYQILLVLSSGKLLPVTKLEQGIFEKEEKLAKQIAQTTGARFVQHFSSESSSPIVVKGANGKYSFSHPSQSTSILGIKVSRSTRNFFFYLLVALLVAIPVVLKLLNII